VVVVVLVVVVVEVVLLVVVVVGATDVVVVVVCTEDVVVGVGDVAGRPPHPARAMKQQMTCRRATTVMSDFRFMVVSEVTF
jgi:hypothetical protein